MNTLINGFKKQIQKIREINKKYAKPKTEISGGVKFALLSLRIYLLFLVVLMVYKFATVIAG